MITAYFKLFSICCKFCFDNLFILNSVYIRIQTAEQMVRMKGGSSIEVDVEVLNKGAISFYTSLQFAKVSVKLDHLIVMRKEFYNA